MLSHPSHAREALSCMQNQKPVISRSLDFKNESDPEVVGQKAVLNLQLYRWRDGGKDYEDGPVSYLYIPIYDNYGEDKTISSMLLANIYWQAYFEGILADNVNGMIAVLENQCGQTFTYEINGRSARYLGPDDLHDLNFESLEESTGFGAFLQGNDEEVAAYNCAYNVRIYPSQQMEDSFRRCPRWSIPLHSGFLFHLRSLCRTQTESRVKHCGTNKTGCVLPLPSTSTGEDVQSTSRDPTSRSE